MKTITLLAAVALLWGSNASASTVNSRLDNPIERRFNLDTPIEFTERGILFLVFPNGEFDFNTEASQNSGIVYRNGHRSNNQTYGVTPNRGVVIEHDALGRVRRIGNVFVNYDAQNRIRRIGSVYMTYNRFALSQIGNLRIVYNRNGQIINIIGSVKGYRYNEENDADCNFYENHNNSSVYYRSNGTKVASTKI
ncbi:MAG TPA: hypothetical protein PLS51_09855 [Flavobacterium sp.]|jgi:hypothetical protein|nr:hypothetical protein [Flavobacterium sp.]HPJ10923.1 hypothetical protein [Flavobacterium sp.]